MAKPFVVVLRFTQQRTPKGDEMNKATIMGMIMIIVFMVPGLASCSSVTTPTDSGATYTTSASPTVVVTRTVPVVVSRPTPPVVVSRPTPPVVINPNPAPNWWHNWRWPWHPRP